MTAEKVRKLDHDDFGSGRCSVQPRPRLHRAASGAEVVVIEFADFLCGHCAQASPEIEAVIGLGLPIDVVFIPVNVGGNPLSKKAGIASLAAFNQGDAQFKRYAKLLFKNHSGLSEADLPSSADPLPISRCGF